MLRVKSPQDFGAGIMFIAAGVAALWLGRDYAVGSLTRMGPGYLPTALSWALTAIGAVIVLRSLALDGPRIEPAALRPQAFILSAIVIFAIGIERLGLAPTVALVAVVAALASREVRGRELVALGLGLAVLCVILFVYLLGQPFQVWAF